MNMGPEILIIDDEQDICELVAGILEDDGFQTRSAYDSAGAIKEITARQPDLVLLDIWLQNSHMDGLELLKEIKKCAPNLPVVMISGHGNIETAVTALKNGAHDYIEKPFETEKLLLVIKRIIERMALKRENDELRMRAGIPLKLIGSSRIVEQLQNHINKIAVTGSRVFIQGETGSGKEVVARLLYKQSSRADGPFIAVNSAVLSSTHLEEVLFGRIRNGRVEPGLFERAHRGVLFFDEIGEMPLETQGRIVRLLVEQKFTRIGDSTPVEVDVRVFSSSTHDPQSLIDTGRLREDLFHRLNVLSLHVPPLSKRREDIPDLIEYFSDELSRISGLSKCPISKETLSILQYYKWPGNVRQLRNCLEHLFIMASGSGVEEITPDMLPANIRSVTSMQAGRTQDNHIMTLPLREARECFEKKYLLTQIDRFDGNISRTASFIEMERSALHRKLKGLGIASQKNNEEDGEEEEITTEIRKKA